MLTSFNTLWTRGVPLVFLSSAGGKRAHGRNNAVFITLAMTGAAYVLDSMLSGEPLQTLSVWYTY